MEIKWIKVGVRVVLYLALFTFFSYFYMVEQMSDFFKGRTTLTSRTEVVKTLEPPTATICFRPALKRSVAKQFNLSKNTDVLDIDIPNFTYPEFIAKSNYILNKDYEILLHKEKPKISQGDVEVDEKKFRVDSIITWEHHTCLKIQPNFSFDKSQSLTLRFWVRFNSSLKEEDKPEKVIFYFTSNDSWQGVIDSTWPQFKPSKAVLKVNSNYWYVARTKEFLHNEGVEDSEKCWLKQFQNCDCTIKCQFVNYTSTLPMCTTRDQIKCMFDEIHKSNLWGKCNRKKKGLYYDGELSTLDNFNSKKDWTVMAFSVAELSKEIKEEVDVITMSELIGSLGGSLGMFFGFSISGYALLLFDKCIMKFMTN